MVAKAECSQTNWCSYYARFPCYFSLPTW